MNLSEVELVLQDLVKEVQETKTLIEKVSEPKEQNDISDALSYSLRMLPKKMDRLSLVVDTAMKKQFRDNGVVKPELLEQLHKSLERNLHLLKNPVDQKIRHEHVFKDWKWLTLLFFFIALTLVLGWRSLDNYNCYQKLLAKYSYVQKVAPNFLRAVDSIYQTNPAFLEEMHQPAWDENKSSESSSKKNRNRKKSK